MKTKLLAFFGLIITVASLSVIFNAPPAAATGETYKWLTAERIEGTNGYLPQTASGKANNGIVTFIREGTSNIYKGQTTENGCKSTITITVTENNSKGSLVYSNCGRGIPVMPLDTSFVILNTQNGPSQNDGSEVPYASVNCNTYYTSGTDLEKNRNRCEAVKACIMTARLQQSECLAGWNACEKSYIDGFTSADQKFCRDKVAAGKLTEAVNPNAATGDENKTTCAVEGIGWIVCPVTNFLAKIVDGAYGFVASLLTVQPLMTTGNTAGIYNAWVIMRNFANVAFVIAFLIIIFSQLTNVGVSNYGIKKMLPRLIIAAILVNISYWVCAIAIDLSNISGSSLYGLFGNIEGQLPDPNFGDATTGKGWEGAAGFILAGGIALGAAFYVTLSAFLPALVAALMAIVTVFLVLTLRQALIILLVVISPLAFVAYLLPNTESLFSKWKGLFQTLLLMYPIIALIFGASALASTIVGQSAAGPYKIVIQIMGALIAILPLAITPVVMKTAGGILNRFGGIVNNPNKGVGDRLKKRAEGFRDYRQDINKTNRIGRAQKFLDRGGPLGEGETRSKKRRFGAWIAGSGTSTAVNQEQREANAKRALTEEKQGYVAGRASTDSAYAKNIAGPTGNVEAVVASAQEAVRKEYMENVGRIQAQYSSAGKSGDLVLEEIKKDQTGEKKMSSEQLSAAILHITTVGRAQAQQNLDDFVAELGTERATVVANNGADDPRAKILKDALQSAASGFRNSKARPKTLPASELAKMDSGDYTDMVMQPKLDSSGNKIMGLDNLPMMEPVIGVTGAPVRQRKMDQQMVKFLSDDKGSKEKLVDMDIDELNHMKGMVLDPATGAKLGGLNAVPTANRQKTANSITELLDDPANALLKSKLEPRQIKALEDIRANIL